MKPTAVQTKSIDMLMSTKVATFEVYDLRFQSVKHQFTLAVKATKIKKSELLSIDNPNYRELPDKYLHLRGVYVNDNDTKARLPVHVVLESGEYARIKTETKPRIGEDNAPVAELTKFASFIMSPGQEFEKNVMLLTQTTHTDYEELCKLDVLGLRDAADQDQTVVFEEFKERLTRSPEGWYETILPWKPNYPYLPSNKENSLRRLQKLNRKLEREGLTKDNDDIIKDQLAEGLGIIEKAPPLSHNLTSFTFRIRVSSECQPRLQR